MNKERLGTFIGACRKEGNMTQKDLAAMLHVTDKAVSKWERGLSYPDVTLLEPLAEALGLTVEELMACRRQAAESGEEPMKALLDISNDSVRTERHRGWSRLIGVLALVLVTVLAAALNAVYVSETRENTILLKETVEGTDCLYVEENGHLLRLKCGEKVDADAVVPGSAIYRLDCRWNRLTWRGTVTGCERTGMESLGGIMDAVVDEGEGPLFGLPMVYRRSQDYYPNPHGEGYLCDYACWVILDGEAETVLTVEDCVSAASWDYDGDGENELVVRTRWAEKPYTVYDMADGEIAETWPDTVPEEVREKLVCVWEQ